MKTIKVISHPEHTPKFEEVDLYFRVKRGQLISDNQESDVMKKEEIKQHIVAEVESYFDDVGDWIQEGNLIAELEYSDGSRERIKYIEDVEDAVYNMIYQ